MAVQPARREHNEHFLGRTERTLYWRGVLCCWQAVLARQGRKADEENDLSIEEMTHDIIFPLQFFWYLQTERVPVLPLSILAIFLSGNETVPTYSPQADLVCSLDSFMH